MNETMTEPPEVDAYTAVDNRQSAGQALSDFGGWFRSWFVILPFR